MKYVWILRANHESDWPYPGGWRIEGVYIDPKKCNERFQELTSEKENLRITDVHMKMFEVIE